MAGGNSTIAARLVARPANDSAPGSRFKLVISEARAGAAPIDATGPVVAAIAHCLWQARGGDPTANWVDAERALDALANTQAALAKPVIADLAEPKPASAPSAVPAMAPRGRQQPIRR